MFNNNGNANCKCCFLKALIDAIQNINCSCNVPQPLKIEGNVTLDNPPIDPCEQALIDILSSTSTYNKIVFKTGDEFQNVTNVTVTGATLKFTNQSQTIVAPVCAVEYVVAG